jgi:hypothetical protein
VEMSILVEVILVEIWISVDMIVYDCRNNKPLSNQGVYKGCSLVEVAGFEPATPCSQRRGFLVHFTRRVIECDRGACCVIPCRNEL